MAKMNAKTSAKPRSKVRARAKKQHVIKSARQPAARAKAQTRTPTARRPHKFVKSNLRSEDFKPVLVVKTQNLGDRIEIRVRDNGGGIPATVAEKIFTPFFTTKPPGEGTGLGLSISHDIIVQGHGGTLDFVSTEGESTEFIVVLPKHAATLHGVEEERE